MKIAGKKIEGPNVETIVIPRTDGREDIVFRAQAVLDYSQFDELCPRPTPPTVMLRGGEKQQDLDDPAYVKRMSDYGEKKVAWMCLKSLEATPNLEWEKVNLGNPNTWLKFEDEFKESGFSEIEIGRIRNAVFVANCLDDRMLETARQSFLAGRSRLPVSLSSRTDETNDTQSGELVNVSASALQPFEKNGTTATTGSEQA